MNLIESIYSVIREGYSIGNTSSNEAERLAMFLNNDVISPETWISWLNNKKYLEGFSIEFPT